MRKIAHLLVITVIYLLSFIAGYYGSGYVENEILKYLVFDVIATIVVFIFSCMLRNSSVYDPYWSFTPMFMSIYLFVDHHAFSVMQIAFLVVFNLWSIRLTANWIHVFTDFSYEDWRYKKYRNETNWFTWPIVNFFGIHLMPTLLVFAGMLPLFEIAEKEVGLESLLGIAIMLWGIGLEIFADYQMASFLRTTTTKTVCKTGLWRYSRHPNYLGEISFWFGVFVAMLPYSLNHWFYGIGSLGMFLLFNIVSIPLMEKRQLSRRPDYATYMEETTRLFVLPYKEAKCERVNIG